MNEKERKEPPKKKKKKDKNLKKRSHNITTVQDQDDLEETSHLVISVNGDTTVFPYDFNPGKTTWEQFYQDVKEVCNVNVKFSMKYENKFGDRCYNTHLNDKSFAFFDKYAKRNIGQESEIRIDVQHSVEDIKSLSHSSGKCVPIQVEDSKEVSEEISYTQALAGFEEKEWNANYISEFDRKVRENVFRMLISKSIKKESCRVCLNKHPLKECTSSPPMNQLTALMTSNEKRQLFAKWNELEDILGNGDLLLNGLFIQCPICGTLVSIGHFNKISYKKDHLYEHIKSCHTDPVKCSRKERCLGYLCIQRYEQYFNNNKKTLLPEAMVCASDWIHQLLPFEIPGSRSSPFDKRPLKSDIPSCENIYCKVHELQSEIQFDIDVTKRPLRCIEFQAYASKMFNHLDLTENNRNMFIVPNTDVQVIDDMNVKANGLLAKGEELVCTTQSMD